MKRLWIILTVLALLAGPGNATPTMAGDNVWTQLANTQYLIPNTHAQPIVEPQLLKELAAKDETSFIVHLREKADLSPARQVEEKLARRQAVVETLQTTAERSQQGLITLLSELRATGHVDAMQPLWVVNAIVVTGDMEALKTMAERPEVERIRADHVRRLPDPSILPVSAAPAAPSAITWNLRFIAAPRVWNELDITGKGVVLANMDSGVDWMHPALHNGYRGGPEGQHNYNWYDATGTYPDAPDDGFDHGTHTMGIMVGYDPEAYGGQHIGVAPGARWMAVKVFDDEGYTTDATLHQGFQWILAPTDLNGENADPALAPDVCNNSWGAANVADATFWDDVAALRAADILPVFSGGNRGALGPGSVGTPSGFPDSFSVAATDVNELLADFSSRGPSYWGETKPDVAAPGVSILSSLPNGRYDSISGTSMAAPHAAGTAALLLEADPALTVDDLEAFMTRTAYDLGPAGPDNGYGAGQLDAFAAVSWALGAGKLVGQVTGADTELPLAAAQVEGISQNRGLTPPQAGHTFRTASDERGIYAVAVPAGHYQVTATAFGYAPQTHDDVEVVDGYRSLRDFQLQPLPTGTISGRALEVGGGLLGPVTIRAEGTPVETLTDRERSGYYDLELPPGTYTLAVSSLGHRTERAVVEVVTGEVTTLAFWMATAPSVLLVDADGWLDDNISLYYQDALDQAGHLYTTRRITDTAVIPTAEELAAYDIVIWVHPWSSPGYFELERHDTAVVDALTTYLLGGGRLLLAGQDIGYWDGNKTYYTQLLHSEYVQDEAFSDGVHGLEGDTLEGVELDFAAIDAYKLLDAPDVIAPADEAAVPIAEYDLPGRAAALRVEDRGYRLVYLAFGLEGSGPRAARAQTLEQALSWLSQPTLKKQMEPAAVAPGGTLRVTLTLHNPLGTTRDVTLRDPLPPNTSYVEGSITGGATYDEATNAILWQGSLLPHETVTLAFATTVRDGPQGDSVIEHTAWLDAPDGPPVEARAATQVEAPNLVLSEKTVRPADVTVHLPLVFAVGAGLRPAPTANASRHHTLSEVRLVEPNDVLAYRVVLRNSSTVAAPSVTLLDPLPPQVSYVEGSVTGEAWYNAAEHCIEWSGPLPAAQPGRPEYLWSDSDAPAGPTFEWVDISRVDISHGGTQVSLGDDQWAGPFAIDFSFPFYGQTFSEFYVSSNGWLSFSQPSSSESSNDPLPSSGAPDNLIAMFWDDLNPSGGGEVRYTADAGRLVVSFLDVPRYSSGGPYTFQAILTPDGGITLQYLTMLGSRLNEATVGIQNGHGSEGLQISYNEHYVHDMLAVRIDPPQETSLGEHTVRFQVRVADDAPDNTPIVNEALIAAGGVTYTRTATLVVAAADLASSEKQVSSAVAVPGDVLTYTITLSNSAEGAAQVTVTDPLPAVVSFVEGSITGGASYDPGRNEIGWQGQLGSGEQWPISFSARLNPELPTGTWVTNTATIDDGVHPPLVRTAVTRVGAPDISSSSKAADRGWAVGGEVLTYTLMLVNSGAVTATSVSLVDPLPPELTLLPDTLTGDATYDPSSGEVRWYGDLAPRAENYSWLDSDTPGGPTFDWLDISEIGTVVPLGDDQWAGPFDIGFAFPFFEEAFSEFYLSSNGWLSLSQPAGSDFGNEYLPSPSAPKNLIAMFWDDLNPSTSGDVRVHSDGRRLVVSYVNISRYGSGGPYSFQAILTPNGDITLQYQTMLGTRLNEATIGIQNTDGSQGLSVAHNEQYVHDDLAVRFEPPARPHEVSFAARLAADLALDTVVTNTAFLTDGWGQTVVLSATVDVNQVDLSGSAVTLAPTLVLPGDRLTCTVTLHNDGNAVGSVAAVLAVPEQTVFLLGSAAGGAVYEEDRNEVRWQGEVSPDGQASFSFAVVADWPMADGTVIRAVATIDDGTHPPFQREAAATVTAPDLSGSSKQAHADWVMVGQVLSYTVEVRNSGSMATEVHFRDPLPAGVTYVEGSDWAGSGSALSYDEVNHTLLWQGVVPPQSIAILRFAVQPLGVTTAHNTATLADGLEVITEVSSSTEVFFPYAKLFLPIMHNYEW